jgi:hypothetical protein
MGLLSVASLQFEVNDRLHALAASPSEEETVWDFALNRKVTSSDGEENSGLLVSNPLNDL